MADDSGSDETPEAVSIGGEVSEGVHVGYHRHADGSLEPSFFKKATDGTPIPPGGSLIYVNADDDGKPWRRVTATYKAGGSGPAQVATKTYRDNFDRIFGKKQPVGQA